MNNLIEDVTKGGKVVSLSDNIAPVRAVSNVGLHRLPLFNESHVPTARLSSTLQELEVHREERWKRGGKAAELKLHWRAVVIQHMLHIVPGETILELGAGSGLLTQQIESLLNGENSHTSVVVFSPELLGQAAQRSLPCVHLLSGDFLNALPSAQFDYVIGSGMLWHSGFMDCLRWIFNRLKPGGLMLFF